LFDKRRFTLAFLGDQALPQAEEQPAVARLLRDRLSKNGFRFFSFSAAQQRGG
jgi:hypothetical protein